MSGPLNTASLDIGNKSLDALWERGNVLSNNIANADTPGYKEKTVKFEDELNNALSDGITDDEINQLTPEVEETSNVYSADGNGVDTVSQMVDLTRNQLQYNYMTKAVSDQLKLMRLAATEGRG